MGEIIGTCGHKISIMTLGNNIKIRDFDDYNNRIVSSVIVCDTCLILHQRNNLICFNEQQEREWLEKD